VNNDLAGIGPVTFVLLAVKGCQVPQAIEKALAAIDLSPEQITALMQRDIMAGRLYWLRAPCHA
jgi:hypothetical protein